MMSLIKTIQNDPHLQTILCKACAENNVAVTMAKDIRLEDYLILRVDAFYTKILDPPPSPDCLIVQHCGDNQYELYLVELKNLKDLRNFSAKEIRTKFQTCFDDFMSNRFRQYFYDLQYHFKNIYLLFVSDPLVRSSQKKTKNHLLDLFLTIRPCHFANKRYVIQPELPNPMIQKCLP